MYHWFVRNFVGCLTCFWHCMLSAQILVTFILACSWPVLSVVYEWFVGPKFRESVVMVLILWMEETLLVNYALTTHSCQLPWNCLICYEFASEIFFSSSLGGTGGQVFWGTAISLYRVVSVWPAMKLWSWDWIPLGPDYVLGLSADTAPHTCLWLSANW